MLGSNIKQIRNYSGLSQSEFANKFNLTRGQIDSYERNIAKPSIATIKAIAEHYGLSIEVISTKDLKLNPGLLYPRAPIQQVSQTKYDDLLKAKDELIKEQREIIKFLQKQVIIILAAQKDKKR